MMYIKERLLAAMRRQPVDIIPSIIYDHHLPRGEWEKKIRELGMGLRLQMPICTERRKNVEVQMKHSGGFETKEYHTPLGTLSMKRKLTPGFTEGQDGRDWFGMVPWITEFLIKKPEDYEAVKFIIEDTEIEPYYEAAKDMAYYLGNEGLVAARIWRTPFQKTLVELAGPRLLIDVHRHKKKVETLFKAIEEKVLEMSAAAADSPADFVYQPENVDGVLTNPPLFEEYCLPVYNKMAEFLQGKKLLAAHFDGRMKVLANAIAQTKIDIIEALTPPPMGDLALSDARRIWKGKTIWMNFPSNTCLYGEEKVRSFTKELLREVAPGEGFIVGFTELIPKEVKMRSLVVVAEVLKENPYPLKT